VKFGTERYTLELNLDDSHVTKHEHFQNSRRRTASILQIVKSLPVYLNEKSDLMKVVTTKAHLELDDSHDDQV